jgi:serine/threonine protein phosphatase PrpC
LKFLIFLEIFEHTLMKNDKFLIIASDGIWEFISNEQAVEIVAPYYFKKKPEEACNELYRAAAKKWIDVSKRIDKIFFLMKIYI